MSWVSICFTVSSPTPTMMSTEVPPNGKFWLLPLPVSDRNRFGRIAMKPRYSEPGNVIRLSTYCRYSAVGRPGRMPGMNPPYFFMSSARSTGLNVMPTEKNVKNRIRRKYSTLCDQDEVETRYFCVHRTQAAAEFVFN